MMSLLTAGSLVNSVAPTFGLGVGAIVTGLLVPCGPHPTRLIFVNLTALFVALVLVTVVLPETVPHVPGVVAALRPEIAVPKAARRAFASAVPTMASTWALGGLVPVSAAAGALLARDMSPPAMARLGSSLLAAGTGLFLLALAWSSITLFVVAAIVAGGGFGTGFLGSLPSVTNWPSQTNGLGCSLLCSS